MINRDYDEQYVYGWVHNDSEVADSPIVYIFCDHSYGLAQLITSCKKALAGKPINLEFNNPYEQTPFRFDDEELKQCQAIPIKSIVIKKVKENSLPHWKYVYMTIDTEQQVIWEMGASLLKGLINRYDSPEKTDPLAIRHSESRTFSCDGWINKDGKILSKSESELDGDLNIRQAGIFIGLGKAINIEAEMKNHQRGDNISQVMLRPMPIQEGPEARINKKQREDQYLYGWVDKDFHSEIMCDYSYGLTQIIASFTKALGGASTKIDFDILEYETGQFHCEMKKSDYEEMKKSQGKPIKSIVVKKNNETAESLYITMGPDRTMILEIGETILKKFIYDYDSPVSKIRLNMGYLEKTRFCCEDWGGGPEGDILVKSDLELDGHVNINQVILYIGVYNEVVDYAN